LGINDVAFFGISPVSDPAPYDATTNRTGWKFAYKGGELVAPFRVKIVELEEERLALKEGESEYEIQQEIIENSLLAEEFEKNPDKDVQLALGDVVYLNLAPLLKPERTEE
jgi:hypothetical protein